MLYQCEFLDTVKNVGFTTFSDCRELPDDAHIPIIMHDAYTHIAEAAVANIISSFDILNMKNIVRRAINCGYITFADGRNINSLGDLKDILYDQTKRSVTYTGEARDKPRAKLLGMTEVLCDGCINTIGNQLSHMDCMSGCLHDASTCDMCCSTDIDEE